MVETTRKSMIVYGNCNATVMADWSRQLLGFDGDVIWARSWGDNTGASDADLGRCEILWVQLDEGNPLQYRGKIPQTCQVVSYPPLNSTRLWPFGYRDPFSSDEPGGFPYGDTLITQISEDDEAVNGDVVRHYSALAEKFDAAFIANSALRDEELIETRDAQCDIKVGEFFRSNFRKHRLHMSFNHPTRIYLEELFRQLVTKSFGEMKWQSVQASIHRWPDEYEPLDAIELPVSAVVARFFDLEWWSESRPLRFYGTKVSMEEHIRRHILRRRERALSQRAVG